MFRSGVTTLIISNDKINAIMKIIKSQEESSLLIKGASKAVKDKAKWEIGGFLGVLLGVLAASLLGNLLTGKQTIRIFKPSRPSINFEIQKYYQNKHKYNGVSSRMNLPKRKDGAYLINLDEFEYIGTHWIALYVNNNNVTYFESFVVEHNPQKKGTNS